MLGCHLGTVGIRVERLSTFQKARLTGAWLIFLRRRAGRPPSIKVLLLLIACKPDVASRHVSRHCCIELSNAASKVGIEN